MICRVILSLRKTTDPTVVRAWNADRFHERTNLMTIGRGVIFATLWPATTVDALGKEERRKHERNREGDGRQKKSI